MADKFKYKVSIYATFEELEAALKEATGNQDFKLDQNIYDSFINQNKIEAEEKEKIKMIIGKYYDELKNRTDSEGLKRRDELMDVARFLGFLKDEIKIIHMGESPDFIIEVNGESVGLEHTRFYDKQLVGEINALERICRTVQEKLLAKYPEEKRIFNIQFDYDEISKIDYNSISSILIEYLSEYLFNPTIVRPELIEKISVSPHATMEIVISEEYNSKEINACDLNALITKKEAKLRKYQTNCGLDKVWLLVIVDGDSEKSDHELSPDLLPQREFDFDNVFVFNTFKQICLSTKFGRVSSC